MCSEEEKKELDSVCIEEEKKEHDPVCSEEEDKEHDPVCHKEENKEQNSVCSEEKNTEHDPVCSEEEKKELDSVCNKEHDSVCNEAKKEHDSVCSEEEKKEHDPVCSEEEDKEHDPVCHKEENEEQNSVCSEEKNKEHDPVCSEEKNEEEDSVCSKEENKEHDLISSEEKNKECDLVSSKEQKEHEPVCSEEKEPETVCSEEVNLEQGEEVMEMTCGNQNVNTNEQKIAGNLEDVCEEDHGAFEEKENQLADLVENKAEETGDVPCEPTDEVEEQDENPKEDSLESANMSDQEEETKRGGDLSDASADHEALLMSVQERKQDSHDEANRDADPPNTEADVRDVSVDKVEETEGNLRCEEMAAEVVMNNKLPTDDKENRFSMAIGDSANVEKQRGETETDSAENSDDQYMLTKDDFEDLMSDDFEDTMELKSDQNTNSREVRSSEESVKSEDFLELEGTEVFDETNVRSADPENMRTPNGDCDGAFVHGKEKGDQEEGAVKISEDEKHPDSVNSLCHTSEQAAQEIASAKECPMPVDRSEEKIVTTGMVGKQAMVGNTETKEVTTYQSENFSLEDELD